ncbi:AfsA-related hotdog domain-containing protein [Nocardioides sp.]|uniref:AfsA-related hotdog domain-containing protein n=1 Tax=Nocardioides sp. TaxID=35761 RepID=UPI002C37E203|nr:AfsA-related hotdog domain-containing protein [Nocardioides sp.]HXH79409.1 AfsA-related hotdog domain-containing protein [Nocardioides sp.]
MQKHIFVIGDRFAGFAREDGVRTVAQTRVLLSRLSESGGEDTLAVTYGQGVSDYEHDLIISDVNRLGLVGRVTVHHNPIRLAGRREVHKNCEVNALIGNLEERDGQFHADLRIHNDNEFLLDHQTGLHVQGIVITEAARQMFLAVGERYLAPSNSEFEYYYVIERMSTTYENFLFPLASSITLTPRSQRRDDLSRVSITCDIELAQAGRRCAVTEVAFTAFAPALIGSKEGRRAEAALAASRQVLPAASPV